MELKTEHGAIIVYGTIIGIFGNRNKNFNADLSQQISDCQRLSKENNFCFIGDFNISFADNYYFTNNGRNELNNLFKESKMNLLTRDKAECIDHIAQTWRQKLVNGIQTRNFQTIKGFTWN